MAADSQSKQEETIFATTDEEAACWFERHKNEDPFPEIAAALLNSADIVDYIAATGMIFPFYPELGQLKSASYEVNILGDLVYWDEKGNLQRRNLKKGEDFTLPRNSIAFVTPEPTFRLPNYVALRFNLRINLVHKGLLLGTGPLVDPGFVGKLLIPLHNLTVNDYTFRGGDPLIWIEFTKLSPNAIWNGKEKKQENVYRRVGRYVSFPEGKKRRTPFAYLQEAAGNNSIRSSIPDAIESTRRSADEARERANSIARNVTWGGIASIVGLVVALGFGLYQIASLVQDANKYNIEASKELNSFQREFKQQTTIQHNEKEQLQRLEVKFQVLEKDLQELSKSLSDFIAQHSTDRMSPQDEPGR